MRGRSRWGEVLPGGSHRPLAVASCRHRAVYEQKKGSGPAAASADIAGAAAGVRSNTFTVPLILANRVFRSQQQAFRARGGRTRARPLRADAARGFLGSWPAGFFSLICHSLRSRSLSCRSSRLRRGGNCVEVRGRARPASSGGDRLGGDCRLRGSAGSGLRRCRPLRQRENGPPSRLRRWSRAITVKGPRCARVACDGASRHPGL